MDMSGEYRIPAQREIVWAALNDPDILAACIPGCESLEKTSPTTMVAKVTTKIGPVKATFTGEVTLTNIRPPEGYTITGEGKGGAAGFAKGGADVGLTEDGGDTILAYTARAQVGGKLAQIGSRLIDSTSKKLADEFFHAFAVKVGGGEYINVPAGVPVVHHALDEPVVEDKAEEAAEFAKETEEKLEVAAARGTLGGPVTWGLLALLVVIVIIYIIRM